MNADGRKERKRKREGKFRPTSSARIPDQPLHTGRNQRVIGKSSPALRCALVRPTLCARERRESRARTSPHFAPKPSSAFPASLCTGTKRRHARDGASVVVCRFFKLYSLSRPYRQRCTFLSLSLPFSSTFLSPLSLSLSLSSSALALPKGRHGGRRRRRSSAAAAPRRPRHYRAGV